MKLFFVAMLGLFLACQPARLQRFNEKECGYVAEIQGQGKDRFDVTFYRSLAEVVDDQVHCDFVFAPVTVENPTYSGKEMLRVESDGYTKYQIADVNFDPANPVLSFQIDGKGYVANLEDIENKSGLVKVRMRSFPPK